MHYNSANDNKISFIIIRWYLAKRALPAMRYAWQIGPFWQDTNQLLYVYFKYHNLSSSCNAQETFISLWLQTFDSKIAWPHGNAPW